MNVLIDIEWVKENRVYSITQLAAIRVRENWKTEATFERLVCPKSNWDANWEHMAYNGYAPDEFRVGVSENTCIAELVKFLDHSDTILCWQGETRRLLKEKAKKLFGKPLSIKFRCVNQAICTIAKLQGIERCGLYELAEAIGIETPAPKHQSTNDVRVLQSVLAAFEYGKEGARNGAPKNMAERRARNADILSRVEYHYIYTPTSKVFHRPSCHLMRNAVDISGCIYYKKAVKERKPCRVCRPEPDEQPKKVEIKDEPEATPPQPMKKIISAKLLGDQWVEITNVKIVGCCHNQIHPGKLTRKIMEAHDCQGKNCRYFEKYAESSYWIAEENKKRHKEQRKQAQRAEKQAAQRLKYELAELRDLFQSYADDAGYEMLMIRLEKERENRYRVFYVSDNPFADGDRFPDLLATIKFFFPQYSIQLRHIKDEVGRFVTIDEYLSRRR